MQKTPKLVQIRPSISQDFAGILPLLAQLWPDRALEEKNLRVTYESILAEDTSCAFCAVADNGSLVGFGTATCYRHNLYYNGGVGYVTALVVHENQRGGGVGRRLMEELEGFSRALGMKAMELDSSFARTVAHDFYERLGYEKRAYAFAKML